MLSTIQKSNSFVILNRVIGELKKAGVSKEDIEAYSQKAMSKDYVHLLRISKMALSKAGLGIHILYKE